MQASPPDTCRNSRADVEMSTSLLASPPASSGQRAALVLEDVGSATSVLKSAYDVTRITHNELMTHEGQDYTNNLLNSKYALVWIATPADWFVRTPGKKATAHWRRILDWIRTATRLRIPLVVVGVYVLRSLLQ